MENSTAEQVPDNIVKLFQAAFDADQLAQEAGCTPDQFRAQLDQFLPGFIASQQRHFARGRELFLRLDGSPSARSVMARVDDHVNSVRGFEDDALCSDAEFEVLLQLAADQDDAEQYEDAAAMYGLLQVVRPDQIQPFINNNIIAWHSLGVNIAAQCYAQTIALLHHPVYSYYAADCFDAAGQEEDAAAAIGHAFELAGEPEWQRELDRETLDGIATLHARLNPEYTQTDGETFRTDAPDSTRIQV